jgi:hypothetical protein
MNWFKTTKTGSTSLPTTAKITDPADTIFSGISVDPADSSLLWFPVPSDFLDDKNLTSGTKVVTWMDYPLVVRFDANVDFYPLAMDAPAGPRVFFPFGTEGDQASHFPLSRAAKTVYSAEIARLLEIPTPPAVYGATEFEITFLTDDTNDDFQINFLRKQGFTVKTAWPQDDITTWSQGYIDTLNSADLIICGRSLNSSQFEDPKKQVWNSLTAPLILNSIHAGRNTKINWFNTAETSENAATLVADIKIADDPILKYAPGISNGQMDWVFPISNILTDVDTTAINGEVVLTFSDGTPLVVRFEPNTEFYAGAGDTAAGPRTYFAFGAEPKSNHFPLTLNAQAVYFAEIMRMLGGEIDAPIFSGIDNTLASILKSAGSFTPMFFNKDVLSYDLNLPVDEDTLTISAQVSESTSKIISGPGTYVILNDTTLTITCASEIGQELTYTLNVIKEGASGIGANEYAENVKVYPNPFNDRIKISTTQNIDIILITDLQGKIVYNETVNKNSTELNLDELGRGMFLMKIQTGNKNYIHKIIKR